MAQADTLFANISNTAQEYIKRMAIMPVAYNVPQNEMMTVERLPQKGIILRVPRVRELIEAVDVWNQEIHLASSDVGSQSMNFDFDQYTLQKLGTYVRISDKAMFSSLLDMVENVGRILSNSMARTMNTSLYNELAAQKGLQWLRTDGANTPATGEVQGRIAAGSPTTITTPSNSAEVDDFWGSSGDGFFGQITFTSGANAGLARRIVDFANTAGVVTHDAFPQAAASADLFNLTSLGDDGTVVGPTDLDTDFTLKSIYKALERCRRYGAGSVRFAGPRLTMTGIRRDNSADVANGVCFVPTQVAQDIKDTLYDNASVADSAYFQTSEGFRRAVGGQISRIGGVMFVETNHFQSTLATTGVLQKALGALLPAMILFQDAGGATVLRDAPGKRQGLVSVMKKPGNDDMSILYGSIKAQGEMWVINRYFSRNSLWGAIMWGTTTL